MPQLHWPALPPALGDGSLRLRGWRAGDADAVFTACQDPAIQRWTTVPAPYEPEHAAGFVTSRAASQWERASGAPMAVVTGPDDEVAGSCGLVAVDGDNLVGEVGYWVAPWARGQHLAERAARLLAGWAFSEAGFQRLELYVEPANAASCAVAERLGCQREGLLRSKAIVSGQRRDMLLYALVKADLEDASSRPA